MSEVHDYFAELYVAGVLADKDWNVYFPHRDKGFDFIISKEIDLGKNCKFLIRPVQVKGKYPTDSKTDKVVYGYQGKLTQVHPEMILAIPYFSLDNTKPIFVAYMPYSQIKEHSRGFRCEPASFKNGIPIMRPYYVKFFDDSGVQLLEKTSWKNEKPSK